MPRLHRSAGFVLLLCLFAARSARALPATFEDPDGDASITPVDSTGVLPRWLHLHGSIGVGWLSAPVEVRQRYQAGQDFEAGLEARPRPGLRFRLNAEYQVLPAVGRGVYTLTRSVRLDGTVTVDSVDVEFLRRAWLGAARFEAQARVLPRVWLLGGFGRGYLASGARLYRYRAPEESILIRFEGSDGWAWIPTIGARYDFDAFGPLFGIETRYSSLLRRQDVLHTWSVRIGWQGR